MTFRSQLDEAGIEYEVELPNDAYTGRNWFLQERENEWRIVKPLMFMDAEDALMVLVPAPAEVDAQKLRAEFGSNIQPAEGDVLDSLLEVEPGAQTPAGSRYGVPTYIDSSLLEHDQVICRDGRARIRLSTTDFIRVVEPEVVDVIGHRRPLPQ